MNKISKNLTNDNYSTNVEGRFQPTFSTFLPSSASFDLNLLYDVRTNFPKNNEAKTRPEIAVLTINNLMKKEEEKEKVIINNKLNTIFPEATKIL